MALKFSVIIHYEKASLFYLKKKNIFGIYHLTDLCSFTLKPEVNTSLEKINVEKWADQAVLWLV